MSLQSSYTQQLYNYKAFLEYFPSKETKVEHTKTNKLHFDKNTNIQHTYCFLITHKQSIKSITHLLLTNSLRYIDISHKPGQNNHKHGSARDKLVANEEH